MKQFVKRFEKSDLVTSCFRFLVFDRSVSPACSRPGDGCGDEKATS